MPKLALIGGSYSSRSLLASAQRCVNLFPESNPADSPFPVTHYQTPGLKLEFTTPNRAPIRLIYRDSKQNVYVVSGSVVYVTSYNGLASWELTKIGELNTLSGPVRATDNGASIVWVDGTSDGWIYSLVDTSTTKTTTDTTKSSSTSSTTTTKTTDDNGITTTVTTVVNTNGTTVTTVVDVPAHTWYQIEDEAWYGSQSADTMDTYMIFGWPGNGEMYTTLSQSTTFDASYYAAKSGAPDPIQAIAVVHKEIWLLGTDTTEVWYDAGNENFPFARIPGVFIQKGVAAVYSVAKADESIFWIGRDQNGGAQAYRSYNYNAVPLATPAIAYEWSTYSDISDATAFCYQLGAHTFYVVTFPSADKTWVFDLLTNQWHEWNWMDEDGVLHRCRAGTHCYTGRLHLVGDWQNGNVYSLDPETYTDNGDPIMRIRSFPHIVDASGNARMFYRQFVAAMEVGAGYEDGSGTDPVVWLRWSDDGGNQWGQPVQGAMGATGQYLRNVQWQRLGMGRDRVFELSWSAPVRTSLNGAWGSYLQGKS
jgi:hypothetical protein